MVLPFFLAFLGMIIFVIALLTRYVLLVVTVENKSMAPTLNADDRVLMVRHWPARWLRKGHIVLIEPWYGTSAGSTFFAETHYIKRIIGLGEETLYVPHSNPLTNTCLLKHKISNEQTYRSIPLGYVFVQGDSPQSVDSRQWGALPLKSVRAMALMKLPHKARPCPTQQMPSFGLPVGQSVPQFVAQTLSDEVVTLANFHRHSILFLFLTPRAIVTYTTQITQLSARGGELVIVSDATLEVTCALIGEFPSIILVLVAPRTSNPFLDNYHIFGTPAFCFVNKHGKVEATGLLGPNMEGLKTQFNV